MKYIKLNIPSYFAIVRRIFVSENFCIRGRLRSKKRVLVTNDSKRRCRFDKAESCPKKLCPVPSFNKEALYQQVSYTEFDLSKYLA